jgi:TonB family protein
MIRFCKYATLTITLALLPSLPARGQTPAQSPVQATAPQAVAAPTYPDTAKGLTELLDDILKTAKGGDRSRLDAAVKDMEIPDYEGWYAVEFGAEKGKAWTDYRHANLDRDEAAIADLFEQDAKGGGKIVVQQVSGAAELAGVSVGANVDCAQQHEDIYVASWRPHHPDNSQSADFTEYFVFGAGRFRWDNAIIAANASCFEGPGPQAVAADQTPNASSAVNPDSAGVGHPNCKSCPYPQFSDAARKAKVQGAVFLTLVIQPDGHATDITLVRGLGYGLDQKAIEAVEGWSFKPGTGPDGAPIAVRVTVQVSFRLL